jgi:outer membrane biosynthesis protein TonB
MIRYYRVYILCVALSVFLAIPASAVCYRYIDDNGIVHFTDAPDTIPEKYQSQIKPDMETTASPKTEESRSVESPDELSFPEAPQAVPATGKPDEPKMSETPKENLQEAPPETETETETNPLSEETKTTADNKAQDAETKKLIDNRKTILEKKGDLDKKFDALIEEKKQLEAGRENLDDEKGIQEYNKNVKRLNEKIKKYKADEDTLRLEIENYNESIKPKTDK